MNRCKCSWWAESVHLTSKSLRRNSTLLAIICSSVLVLPSPSSTESDPVPPGHLIDIGGRRLHLNCTGSGVPTIVAESGLGGFSTDWALVQPEVSKFTRFCSYDRAGYAWSDNGPALDMVEETVDDLRMLLRKAGVDPPYVLIGASLGGLYVRAYQRRFPEEVAGLVLADASSEHFLDFQIEGKDKVLADMSAEELRRMFEARLRAPATPRILPTTVEAPADRLPKEAQSARLWALRKLMSSEPVIPTFSGAESWREEFIALRPQSPLGHPLGDLQLIVLIRGLNTDNRHREVAAEFAALSRVGKLVVAEQSEHEIHMYRPDLVVQSLKDLVVAARNRIPKSDKQGIRN
jgi:pimeloyl-ACP methyl ester carboxylesterase